MGANANGQPAVSGTSQPIDGLMANLLSTSAQNRYIVSRRVQQMKPFLNEARDRMLAVLAHHHNEVSTMQRKKMAEQYGYDPNTSATPYPGTQQTSVVNNKGLGPVALVLVAVATAIGGAGLAVGIPALLKGSPVAQSQPPQQPPPQPSGVPTTPDGYELQRWDGTKWVPVDPTVPPK